MLRVCRDGRSIRCERSYVIACSREDLSPAGWQAFYLSPALAATLSARLIEAMLRDGPASLEQKDFDKFASFFPPDFTCSMRDGTTLDRKTFLHAVADELRTAVQPITISLKQVRPDIHGDSAASVTDETTEYSVHDAPGDVHRVRYSQRMEAHLAKVGGRWLNQSVKYPERATMWLDNRPIDSETLKHTLGR